MSIDRLSNMLSALKNASLGGKDFVEVPHTKECEAVAKVLKSAGFLSEAKAFKEKGVSYKKLRLEISGMQDMKRLSKPGRRVYKKAEELRSVAGGYGVLVISTSRGVMSGQEAKKKKLGGEVLCSVW